MRISFQVQGGDFVNAGKASSSVKDMLKQLDVPSMKIKRIVIALYEAEVNVAAHAKSGKISVEVDSEEIVMMIEDEGPGIDDLDLAMREGFSTASKEVREMGFGAGMGLPNIKKNSDSFHIETIPGKGTTLVIKNRIAD